jgi:hypothetical protein
MIAGEHGARMQYNGGPVQHEPKLYLVFWGGNWEGNLGLESELRGLFYGNLAAENDIPGGTAAWQGILSQYYSNTAGPYRSATIAAESHVNNVRAPQNIEDQSVQEEVDAFVRELYTKGTPPNANAQFIVLPTPGSTYKDETLVENGEIIDCAYHDVTGAVFGANEERYSYTLIPYGGDVVGVNSKGEKIKCNYAVNLGGSEEEQLDHSTSFVASHEFAESVTDPLTSRKYNSAKEDPYRKKGNENEQELYGWTGAHEDDATEIADECITLGPFQLSGKRAWVTKLWDDEGGNECKLEDPPYEQPPAPSATTGAASEVEESTAKLEGSVNPHGPDAEYQFEYGTTTSYGSDAPVPAGNAGIGTATVTESTTLSGLTPNTVYHYRLVAKTWAGESKGEDKTFRTKAWKIQTTQNPHGSDEFDGFRGVSCWSATGCDAVGNNTNTENEIIGLVERWNGSGWEVQSTPKSTGAKEDNLESVACRSASECEATGYAEVAEGKHVTLAERWNGTAWSVQSTPTSGNDANLESVSCASASECVASGFDLSSAGKQAALVELWNGKEWKTLTTATLPKEDEQSWLESVSCPSSKHCTAVGAVVTTLNGIVPLAEGYNGTTWSVQTTPTPEHSIEAQLSGVSCSGTSACTAVGGYDNSAEKGERALIERYNGTSWQLQEAASPVGKPAPKESHWALNAVSCPTSGSCVAVGSYAESAAGKKLLLGEDWNGTSWELVLPVDRAAALYDEARGVSCSAALTCTLAGLSVKENNHNLAETLAERMEL